MIFNIRGDSDHLTYGHHFHVSKTAQKITLKWSSGPFCPILKAILSGIGKFQFKRLVHGLLRLESIIINMMMLETYWNSGTNSQILLHRQVTRPPTEYCIFFLKMSSIFSFFKRVPFSVFVCTATVPWILLFFGETVPWILLSNTVTVQKQQNWEKKTSYAQPTRGPDVHWILAHSSTAQTRSLSPRAYMGQHHSQWRSMNSESQQPTAKWFFRPKHEWTSPGPYGPRVSTVINSVMPIFCLQYWPVFTEKKGRKPTCF